MKQARDNATMIISISVACMMLVYAFHASKNMTRTQEVTSSAIAVELAPPPHVTSLGWYPVVRVLDGDTIIIEKDGRDVHVRLIGLDTPETVDPRTPIQCFGKEASDEARRVLDGVSVRIETDSSQDTYDQYGRLLAYVYAPSSTHPDGFLFNQFMIAEGYGHEYTYRTPYLYQTLFKAAEQAAHAAGKGLWAASACVDTP